MIRILTYGTFNRINTVHLSHLKLAKEYGHHLTVGLATDELIESIGKYTHQTYEERKVILESIHYVDKVIPEDMFSSKINDVIKYNINIVVVEDKFKNDFNYLKKYCEIKFLPTLIDFSQKKVNF